MVALSPFLGFLLLEQMTIVPSGGHLALRYNGGT